MINSVFGKTIKYFRKRINIRLVINKKDFLKYTSRPTHITYKIFDKNYPAIHEIKPVLTLNKPIYVAFTVLYSSKCLMYDFHYNFIKNDFMVNYYLLTQTVLLTKSNQKMFMQIFLSTNICLTLVIFQKTQIFFNSPNKMVVDQTKIVYKEIPVNNFIGLKLDMRSLLSDDGKESDTAKGVINITLVLMVFIPFLIFKKDLRKEILTDDHKQEEILIDNKDLKK